MVVTTRVTVVDTGVVASAATPGNLADRPGEHLYVENPEENAVDIYWCGEGAGASDGKRLRPGEGFGCDLEADEEVRLFTTTGQEADDVEVVRTGVPA